MINFTRIGVDLSLACSDSPRGIGVYEKNISLPLSGICSSNKVFVFGIGKKPEWIDASVVYVNTYSKNVIIREQIILPFLCLILRIQKLHLFANVVPLMLIINPFCQIFLTIHDVSYKYDYSYMDSDEKQNTLKRRIGLLYQSWMLKYSFWRSDRIFSVSKWASLEIEKFVNNKTNKSISVVPNICNDIFYNVKVPNWKNREDLIIVVAGAHPQKNIPFLLSNIYKHQNKDAAGFKYIFIGITKDEVLDKYSNMSRVSFHGMVSQERLLSLYDKCKLLIMPSYFESFSIPLIEADQRGLWILSSFGGATKEVAPEHTLFFDPSCDKSFNMMFDNAISKLNNSPSATIGSAASKVDIRNLYWGSCYKINE